MDLCQFYNISLAKASHMPMPYLKGLEKYNSSVCLKEESQK